MRLRAFVPACALLLGFDASSHARDAGADPVVVSVGQSEVTQSELRFRLGRLHEFERESYGRSPDAVRRGFLDRKLVPELLYAEEGKRRRALESPAVAAKIRAALAQALKEELERSFDAELGRAEIQAFCKSTSKEADAGDGRCDGDLSGYRVVLRRQRASDEMTRLARELREKHVAKVEYDLLDRVAVRADDSAAPTPPPE